MADPEYHGDALCSAMCGVCRSLAVQVKRAEWINNTPKACSLWHWPNTDGKEVRLGCDWMLDSAGRPDRQHFWGPLRQFKAYELSPCSDIPAGRTDSSQSKLSLERRIC